jgi:RNA polymerase sigma-19 factor, ECF subfamily
VVPIVLLLELSFSMLVQNALSNEEVREQLQSLYVDNNGWLQGWLNKRLGCSFRSADLMHDTFLRLLARDEWLQAREPKAYLMTVAKRVLIDHWRRERVEKAYLDALMQIPVEYAPAPEEQHMLLETLQEIDCLLEGLPVVVKRAFLYAQLDGLKQMEIANKLNISVSTVKRYLIMAGTQCYFALSEAP